MKTKILILVSIIFAGFISSCNKTIETIQKQELINLIETDQVKQIDVVDRKEALIVFKEEVNKPKRKMQIGSFNVFASTIINIANKNNVIITYTSHMSGSNSLFFYAYPILLLGGIILYFIGGMICLYLTMKNEFKNPHDKIAWVITIIFAPVMGVLLFLILGRKQIKTTAN